MLFTETVPVCCENRTKHKYILWEEKTVSVFVFLLRQVGFKGLIFDCLETVTICISEHYYAL
jgi:hypothetical protein